MKYKSYNCNSFNVHTIKTDRFKTSHIEIVFRGKAEKEEMSAYTMLSDYLTDTSNLYPSRKDVIIKLEGLYRTLFYGVTSKVGSNVLINFVLDFINPEFISEDNYLEEVMKFPFDMLNNPHVINEEFDIKYFNIIKNRLEKDIKSVQEDCFKLCINHSLDTMDENSPASFRVAGTLEDLNNVTPAYLYKIYKKMMKEMVCDIFIIGNLDMDEVVTLIKKYFHRRIINNNYLPFNYENILRKKPLVVQEDSDFLQSNINIIYNLIDLTKYEKDIVFQIYKHILGSGGLTSNLYQELRVKNTFCYAIDSMYLKYDNLFMIHVSLENENVDKSIRLIKKTVKGMELGKFSDEAIDNAINSVIMGLNLGLDNQVSILNNYTFKVYDGVPDLIERKELFSKVTREDIIKVAKKVKINTIYILKGSNK